MKTGRRTFLKTVAIASQAPVAATAQEERPTRRSESSRQRRTYTGRQLAMIAFPLGGVGAGSISLGGRGQLRDWEVFNRPDKGNAPSYGFAAIRAEVKGAKAVSRVLEARLAPPYEGASGLGTDNVPGLPRLESATFAGQYPLAQIRFRDSELPVNVSLEAFSPFIPHEEDDSGLPVAVLRYRVDNPGAQPAAVSVVFSLDNPVGREGRANEFRSGSAVSGLLMQNPFLANTDPLSGSFAVAVANVGDGSVSHLRGWRGGTGWRVGPLLFWDDFTADGTLTDEAQVRDSVGSICLSRSVPAGGEADFTFLLAWHFPNRTPKRCGWSAPKGSDDVVIGNHYCTRFKDAWAAAQYAAENLDRLDRGTKQFVSAIAQTTLPAPVIEAAISNLSTLATTTCFRTSDGEFHAFEGSSDKSGCCFGDCTHVWNYETALAHVFPSLSHSMRESAFGISMAPDGRMNFRRKLPDSGTDRFDHAAADGQMGQIMKLYLDWKLSGDTDWLRKLWPNARRALEYAWIEGGWDGDRDGVMEGVQHNTYDVEFFGPNPLCGIWFLGALRAGEEMARALGETAAADEYRRAFLNGSKWIDANLFNGEFYIQKVRGVARDKVAKALVVGMGSANTENPEFQLGEGCLIDQLCGEYYAQVCGLGSLVDAGHARRALESLYKYNYKRSLYGHESVQRVYALNDEAAMVICHYPSGKRPQVPFPYFAEVMTGFEYAAAAHMLFAGMTEQGIELISNIRKRYDGERRNPYDEAECGHHYARAMASWSGLLALSGFRYDGPTRAVTVKPGVDSRRVVSFWSTGTGWGTFEQDARRIALNVLHGTLSVRTVELSAEAQRRPVTLGGAAVAHRREASKVILDTELTLREGQTLAL